MMMQVLAERGHNGYRNCRIPALVVLGSGRLLAVHDARSTVDDLPGPIDLVARHSDDDGRTWSEPRVLRAGEGYQGFGDASLVVDASTGRVFCFHTATERAGFFESRVGAQDSADIVQCDLAYSDDEGITWNFERITPQLKTGPIAAMFAASGAGLQLTSGHWRGRLLQPFVIRLAGEGTLQVAVARSDDHGASWQLGQLLAGGNESALAELVDGTVLLHSRDHPRRREARSLDGGRTFGELVAVPDLVDPSDNGSLLRLRSGELICTHNAHETMRVNTVVQRSEDGGCSWGEGVVLCAGSSGYSIAVELASGEIAVLFEREGYSQLVVAILDGDEPAEQAPAPRSANAELALRMIATPTPAESAEGFRIALDDGGLYDEAAWREVAGAQGQPGHQVIHTRAELDRLLGPARPGLQLGDELFFSLQLAAGDRARSFTVQSDLGGAPRGVRLAAGSSRPGTVWCTG